MALNRRVRFHTQAQAHMHAYAKSEATGKSIERTYTYIFVYSSPFGYSSCVPPPVWKKGIRIVYGNEYKFVPFRS